MKRRNQTKRNIAVLCLALVIALGTLGVGYAGWSANVTIEQEVYSGTWEAEVISTDYDLADTCEDATLILSASAETLTVQISNAPPCCSGNITFTIDNTGTIPVKITKVEFLPNGDGTKLTECDTLYFDLVDGDDDDLSLHLRDDPKLIGEQFDPSGGDPDHVDGKIYFHVEAGASDNLTTDFDLEFEVVPWNRS
jgi:hypothetical protein